MLSSSAFFNASLSHLPHPLSLHKKKRKKVAIIEISSTPREEREEDKENVQDKNKKNETSWCGRRRYDFCRRSL
tara:strand:+ start:5842 stop:6063 length:222 start_codon:yes stop_codon:yes gene_type:complete